MDKIGDAGREFQRAKELDPYYFEAYLGLGVTLGRLGDPEGGLKMTRFASSLAKTREDRERVQAEYDRLSRLAEEKKRAEPPEQPLEMPDMY